MITLYRIPVMGLRYTESGDVIEVAESMGGIRAKVFGVRIPVRLALWLCGVAA